MKKNSKKSILLLSIGGGLFICLISIYLSRNMLLQSITNKRTTHIEQTYGLQIHYQNLQMKGCSEVTLQGLSIVPDQRDTLLTLQSVNVRLNFWELLKGNIEVRNVHMNGLAIAFIKRDSAANYDFLFSGHHPEATTEPVIETNYAHRINRILNLIYGFFPENRTKRQQFRNSQYPHLYNRKQSLSVHYQNKRRYTDSTMESSRRTEQKGTYPAGRTFCHRAKESFTTVYQPPFWSRSYFRYLIL